MKQIFRILLILFLSSACVLSSIAQTEDNHVLIERLQKQRFTFPQEKLHIMTDAELYAPGDTIWMRIWVQDGTTLRKSELENNFVNVELRDSRDQKLAHIKVKRQEDKFSGYLILPQNIISGHYTLCAYTWYMYEWQEQFFFRKEIHVITKEHSAKGYTARQLYENERAKAEPLEPSGYTTRISRSQDTLTTVSFDAPPLTWYAISVTDDQLSPIDTTVTISEMLPKVPNLFTLEKVSKDTTIYSPSGMIEDEGFVIGQYKQKNRNNVKRATVLNLKDQRIYFANIINNGYFSVKNIDLPEGSILWGVAYDEEGYEFEDLEIYNLMTPDTIHHLIPQKKYFVNSNNEELKKRGINANGSDYELTLLKSMAETNSSDSIRLLDEIVSTHSKSDKKAKELQELISKAYYRDDVFTRNASKSLYEYNFPESSKKQLVKYVIEQIKGIIVEDSVAYYKTFAGEKVPVRFFANTREIVNHKLPDGNWAKQEALYYPLKAVYAIDFLEPTIAKSVSPNHAFSSSPIIRIDVCSMSEFPWLTIQYQRFFDILGYEKTMRFLTQRIRRDKVHTRYWNPAVNSGKDGRITIDLPLPTDYQTTYTLRAEGVTEEGQPVSIIRRIQIK